MLSKISRSAIRVQPVMLRYAALTPKRWRSEAVAEVPLKSLDDIYQVPMDPGVGSLPYILNEYPDDIREDLEAKGFNGFTACGLSRYDAFAENMWNKAQPKEDGVLMYGIPGVGAGPAGGFITVRDPDEYMKVLRAEGEFPSGAIEVQWFMKEYFIRKGTMQTSLNYWGRGEEWQKTRRVIQKDLMMPKAVMSYGNNLGEAMALASPGAEACKSPEDFNEYIIRTSFDMFTAAFFGRMTQSADLSNANADPLDRKFCNAAVGALNEFFPLIFSPRDMILNHTLPEPKITTERYQKFSDCLDICYERGTELIYDFKERMDAGELTDQEKNSYLYTTLQRESGEESSITTDQFVEMATLLLIAAVDTTSGYTRWLVSCLATMPELQERVYQEVIEATGPDGKLSSELLKQRDWLPLLHAVKRESHRMKPALNVILKTTDEPLEIAGYDVPGGNVMVMDTWFGQNDPEVMPDKDEFKPERWFPEAVAARKGTPAEIIDHPLYKGPFSAGARQCPAVRVADVEVMFMAAQLVKDYKITCTDPAISTPKDIDYRQELVYTPLIGGDGLKFERR